MSMLNKEDMLKELKSSKYFHKLVVQITFDIILSLRGDELDGELEEEWCIKHDMLIEMFYDFLNKNPYDLEFIYQYHRKILNKEPEEIYNMFYFDNKKPDLSEFVAYKILMEEVMSDIIYRFENYVYEIYKQEEQEVCYEIYKQEM